MLSIPACREAQRYLDAGDPATAVRVAFPLVMMDVQRVYDLKFPPHWTSRDVLAHGLRPDMGRLIDLLWQLHRLYEPVRFGSREDWVSGDVTGLMRKIYTETGLRTVPRAPAGPEPVSLGFRRTDDRKFRPDGGG